MSRRLARQPELILAAGEHYVEFTRENGRLHPTPAPTRQDGTEMTMETHTGSIPVTGNPQTGTPIGDRLATGGIQLDDPPIPTVPEKIAEDEVDRLNALHGWWEQESARDARDCLAKLIEYGSSDFDIMAHSMLAVGGAIWSGVPDAERMRVGREMAIAFYLQGKVARAFGAFEHGRMPSDDTIDDIVRYGMMWKRVRQTGAWA